MNPWWRDETNRQPEPKPVFLLGYVFLRNNGFRRQLSNIDNLFVGGDTRYGLGEISLMPWENSLTDALVFGKHVNLSNEHPEIFSDFVWGHVPTDGHAPDDKIRGAKEFLAGWEIASPSKGCLTWAPGSSLEGKGCWAVDTYGNWIYQGACKQ
ncbi:MAG: hypothetical protein HY742_03645 [Deltaproteobacteria bacterium]|nr:hypothetical protein [Deltaproteobacteria bacterium]